MTTSNVGTFVVSTAPTEAMERDWYLKVNLASKMATMLLFQFNKEFIHTTLLDREPRGASLAEKVTIFYACSSDLHTLSCVKVVVCRTHSGGYGQGGDEKIKLLLNCIAVIKKSIFYSITRKITCIFKS